jgi:hypothetical protein
VNLVRHLGASTRKRFPPTALAPATWKKTGEAVLRDKNRNTAEMNNAG